ncbi:LysR family transcriptional regulator [Loigolactobacillus coryniformis]|jgi:molybdate transport system regulatory protein|uniref:LysR family transcriptional regulator n=1 Tax=Loigolactobacillus coryniformis subsp. torquens DSM 20004 = KCTC 3535 TaxID=1423822 RepID=A0A2D1KM15_9LACO|nr:LysR family transcriptional regulator [Loigolactobacillus coryniformis]ATO43173.1 LysR family transcriptional regulator [Loigolactobacillus coryniformis subsp. torquens DSM 20004 = KCTC 3535]KRK84307.1 molybdenum transporter [Loigolactobacillus coryniformis subsp. torquens DSM 20004 = KCTC 3535]MCL5457786.1 LysR family transcriptional regulator [Loigolactobacillus coryniformis]MDT3392209.1 LysR family transcriptional regulator [Bacillota bacterium]
MGNLDYSLSLYLTNKQVFLGPEIVQLMQLIQSQGSLTLAASAMGISYNKAWRLVHQAEQALARPLVVSNTGGINGGGSSLTAEGQRLMVKYLRWQSLTQSVVRQYFKQIFEDES